MDPSDGDASARRGTFGDGACDARPRRVAVVIPSHGRREALAACPRALARQASGPPATIVVDDGSPVPLRDVCAAAGGWVRCLRKEKGGPAAARNVGLRAAEGAEIVLFTDDDCRPRRDWAGRMAAAVAGGAMRLVGGRVDNALAHNLFSETSQSIQTHLYGTFRDFSGHDAFFSSNNLAVRRADLLRIGGFDEGYAFASEDRDLSRRWREAGGAMFYAPDATVDHHHGLTAAGFARQHWAYGRGARHYHLRHAAADGAELFRNPPGFYARLLFHPFKRPSLRAAALTALVGVAHAMQLGGYVAERHDEGRARSREPARPQP